MEDDPRAFSQAELFATPIQKPSKDIPLESQEKVKKKLFGKSDHRDDGDDKLWLQKAADWQKGSLMGSVLEASVLETFMLGEVELQRRAICWSGSLGCVP